MCVAVGWLCVLTAASAGLSAGAANRKAVRRAHDPHNVNTTAQIVSNPNPRNSHVALHALTALRHVAALMDISSCINIIYIYIKFDYNRHCSLHCIPPLENILETLISMLCIRV